jgi:hypothetical protein
LFDSVIITICNSSDNVTCDKCPRHDKIEQLYCTPPTAITLKPPLKNEKKMFFNASKNAVGKTSSVPKIFQTDSLTPKIQGFEENF